MFMLGQTSLQHLLLMAGRGLIDHGRLKGFLSITVTFLHCQRPERLGLFLLVVVGFFVCLLLMWILANQLFQSF